MDNHNTGENHDVPPTGEEYEALMRLEELESLLEELEEAGYSESTARSDIPHKLGARMWELGIKDLGHLRQSIRRLHAELDASP